MGRPANNNGVLARTQHYAVPAFPSSLYAPQQSILRGNMRQDNKPSLASSSPLPPTRWHAAGWVYATWRPAPYIVTPLPALPRIHRNHAHTAGSHPGPSSPPSVPGPPSVPRIYVSSVCSCISSAGLVVSLSTRADPASANIPHNSPVALPQTSPPTVPSSSLLQWPSAGPSRSWPTVPGVLERSRACRARGPLLQALNLWTS